MCKIILAFTCFAVSAVSFAQTDSSAFYLQKAFEEKAKGRKMEVVKALEKAYNFDKTNQQVVTELASAYLDVRILPSARKKFMEAEILGDTSLGTYQQLMNLNFNMHEYTDAIKYAQLVKKADSTQKVSYILGKSHYDQQSWSKSIPFLNDATKEDSSNAEIYYLLARANFNMKNFEQAVPHFQKALQLQPNNYRWLYELAATYYYLQDDEKAWDYLVEAGEKAAKQDKDYMQNLAVTYYNAGKFEESLKTLKEVSEERPNDIELTEFVADFCYDAKRYDDAIAYYYKVLALDSTKADDLYMIGLAYQKKGEKEKGLEICQKAIAMDPKLQRFNQGRRRGAPVRQ